MVPNKESIECQHDKGHLFIDIKESDLNCNMLWQNITIGLSTTFVMLIVIGVFSYKKKNKDKGLVVLDIWLASIR